MEATLRLVRVELPRALFRREPFIVATAVAATTRGREVPLALDTTEQFKTAPTPPPAAAAEGQQEPAAVLAPIVTEPAEGVDRAHPLELDLALYGPADPGAFLVVSGAVMESDRDFRKTGEVLDVGRHHLQDSALARTLVVGIGGSGAALVAVEEAIAIAAKLLQGNGDDKLCDFSVRFSAEDLVAGVQPDGTVRREVKHGGGRCVLTFVLEVTGVEVPAAAPAESAATSSGTTDNGAGEQQQGDQQQPKTEEPPAPSTTTEPPRGKGKAKREEEPPPAPESPLTAGE